MSEQQQSASAAQGARPTGRPGDPRASWATWTTQSIISGPGGVTTAEVGPISGDLTVHTTWVDGEARLTVQYTGALDWYTVAGSPVPHDGRDHGAGDPPGHGQHREDRARGLCPAGARRLRRTRG